MMRILNQKQFISFPTLFRWNSSDNALKWATYGGIAFSCLAFFGFGVTFSLFMCWILYLSFYLVGYPFLSFQWDALLVETGLIAIFYSLMTPPPLLLHIALWALVFKLMLSSGLVKWLSGCPKWRLFLALDYHFETQPLPNIGGFLVHQIIKKGTRLVAGLVFVFEVFVPILFFGTPGMRVSGALLTLFFQFLIIATGNYAFFNLLTIALCMPLIDDSYFPSSIAVQASNNETLAIALNGIGSIFILYNVLILIKQFLTLPYNIWGMDYLRSIGVLNTYGLFAVMTTIRDEIIVEGSQDAENWKEYVFKYKPGLSSEGLKQIAPLQPRLDWQMWFAALSHVENESWFQNFVLRLLQGAPEVLKLLKCNPFPNSPPQYIRAMRYRFHFNTYEEWQKSGKFWNKKLVGVYLPEVKL